MRKFDVKEFLLFSLVSKYLSHFQWIFASKVVLQQYFMHEKASILKGYKQKHFIINKILYEQTLNVPFKKTYVCEIF